VNPVLKGYGAAMLAGSDLHADPLVESYDYPRPHPGWFAVRAWWSVPLHLRVEFSGEILGSADPCGPNVHMVGTFQHPDFHYVQEVSRQLLSGERIGFASAADSNNWMKRAAVWTETCEWGSGTTHRLDGKDVWAAGAPLLEYRLWGWDEEAEQPRRCTDIPVDIFRATWEPARVARMCCADHICSGTDEDTT
jgi:hypothetical protein